MTHSFNYKLANEVIIKDKNTDNNTKFNNKAKANNDEINYFQIEEISSEKLPDMSNGNYNIISII